MKTRPNKPSPLFVKPIIAVLAVALGMTLSKGTTPHDNKKTQQVALIFDSDLQIDENERLSENFE